MKYPNDTPTLFINITWVLSRTENRECRRKMVGDKGFLLKGLPNGLLTQESSAY